MPAYLNVHVVQESLMHVAGQEAGGGSCCYDNHRPGGRVCGEAANHAVEGRGHTGVWEGQRGWIKRISAMVLKQSVEGHTICMSIPVFTQRVQIVKLQNAGGIQDSCRSKETVLCTAMTDDQSELTPLKYILQPGLGSSWCFSTQVMAIHLRQCGMFVRRLTRLKKLCTQHLHPRPSQLLHLTTCIPFPQFDSCQMRKPGRSKESSCRFCFSPCNGSYEDDETQVCTAKFCHIQCSQSPGQKDTNLHTDFWWPQQMRIQLNLHWKYDGVSQSVSATWCKLTLKWHKAVVVEWPFQCTHQGHLRRDMILCWRRNPPWTLEWSYWGFHPEVKLEERSELDVWRYRNQSKGQKFTWRSVVCWISAIKAGRPFALGRTFEMRKKTTGHLEVVPSLNSCWNSGSSACQNKDYPLRQWCRSYLGLVTGCKAR